jgi:hypothetical protein
LSFVCQRYFNIGIQKIAVYVTTITTNIIIIIIIVVIVITIIINIIYVFRPWSSLFYHYGLEGCY